MNAGSSKTSVVGVAAEFITAHSGLALSKAVLIPGVTRAVVAEAVELDGQTAVWPSAINSPAADRAVRLRQRLPRIPEPLHKARLEPAQTDRHITVDDSPQSPGAGSAWAACEHLFDVIRRNRMANVRLVARPAEQIVGQ